MSHAREISDTQKQIELITAAEEKYNAGLKAMDSDDFKTADDAFTRGLAQLKANFNDPFMSFCALLLSGRIHIQRCFLYKYRIDDYEEAEKSFNPAMANFRLALKDQNYSAGTPGYRLLMLETLVDYLSLLSFHINPDPREYAKKIRSLKEKCEVALSCLSHLEGLENRDLLAGRNAAALAITDVLEQLLEKDLADEDKKYFEHIIQICHPKEEKQEVKEAKKEAPNEVELVTMGSRPRSPAH